MSMIFDGFPSVEQARAFRLAVKQRVGLDGQVFEAEAEAQDHDPFPGKLDPPIVHIDRDDRAVEQRVIDLVIEFGGTFAGT